MKIVRYQDGNTAQVGILEGDTVFKADGDMFGQLSKGAQVGSLQDVTLLTPVDPGKIVAVGLNYAAHAAESGAEVPDEPVIFMKPQSSLLAQDGVIELPPADRIDYEAELCIVIGKEAYRVSEDEALSYVLGYTCGNDVSHRDYQRKDGQWVRAKGFNTFTPLGPCIETELDPNNVGVRSRLNGETRQDSNTSDFVFGPAFVISFISNVMTLNPGDVIMTGTPEGVGPMKAGDTIEVEVEGIGVLRNTCRDRD